MTKIGYSLERIADSTNDLKQIYKSDLNFGDLLLINTRNSVYSIHVLENDIYLVSGGWFDKKRLSPFKTKITGCTWGGSIIKVDIAAACGLCLEFGNRVVTTAIQKVCLVKYGSQN